MKTTLTVAMLIEGRWARNITTAIALARNWSSVVLPGQRPSDSVSLQLLGRFLEVSASVLFDGMQ